ncbi:AbrB family looped-hinge helix DNA binding protein [Rhizobium leguminosarum]|jgi:AbrB family looped-hinge helix DNA binding protein|uniref:AbrB family transcriptional regulator n=1 Tax=Rhizobium leguminosarum bv. trifolii TaxID=386 RepID=A0A1C9HMR0_RHILT|nr:AbrB family transcriptional regulator [Rhizobium leguminosarum bv. trifolii]MBA8832297.1 AbrB family looped-hinge helix DNA binding protein [Rhizobium leguminosarum]MDH6274918.1 AbrB family looped-hinge helix DNA binding protein [Rhizobium leguminosarum]
MTTTVTAKGQVTIPKAVRELLGIVPGSEVDFHRTADGSVVLTS